MRRPWTRLALLVAAGLGGGCHHTCGKCDCDWNQDPCAYYTPYHTSGCASAGPYYTPTRVPSSYHELPPPPPAPPTVGPAPPIPSAPGRGDGVETSFKVPVLEPVR